MRILFLTDNFPPEVNAPATRVSEHCREWQTMGAQVTVVTGAPNFPHGKVYDGYRNRLFHKEKWQGIRLVRVWTYIAANAGFIKRIIDYISFAISAFGAGLGIKTDVIIATSPQFFTAVAGFLLATVKRKPWIFELRDLWPESIRAVGAMRNERVLRWLEKLELFLYRRATLIVANTHAFKSNLIGRGIAATKIKVVPNGANLELYQPRRPDPKLSAELGLTAKFVVGYIGTLGMAHGLDFILRAWRRIEAADSHLLFIGDGAKKHELQQLCIDYALANVSFVGLVNKDRVPDYLALLDVALINLKRSELFQTVIPSKIFEAAAMARPILLGVEGEARQLVEKYQAGLCFLPEDEPDFVAKLLALKNDPRLYQQLQDGGLQLAQDYNRKVLARQMLDAVAELLPGTPEIGI